MIWKLQQNKPISTRWYYVIRMIAIVCMIVDHTAKVVRSSIGSSTALAAFLIGRIAFPLFVWELVN